MSRHIFFALLCCAIFCASGPLRAQLPPDLIDIEARSGIILRGEQVTVLVAATPGGDIVAATADGTLLGTVRGEINGTPGAFCLWRPPHEQILHGYIGSDVGEIVHHLLLFDQQDRDGGEAVIGYRNRVLAIPGPVTACAVDETAGQLYVAVRGGGVRRFAAAVPADRQIGVSLGSIVGVMRGLVDPELTGGEPFLEETEIGWAVEAMLVIEGPGGGDVLLLGGEDGQVRAVNLTEEEAPPSEPPE